MILIGYTYSLLIFCVSFQSILKYETAFPLKFSIFTYLQVRQFCYPNMASLPTAYSICAGILFCNMSQSKMSIQSKAMLLFLVERWVADGVAVSLQFADRYDNSISALFTRADCHVTLWLWCCGTVLTAVQHEVLLQSMVIRKREYCMQVRQFNNNFLGVGIFVTLRVQGWLSL